MTAVRPVALALLLACAAPSAPAEVVIEVPVPLPDAPQAAAPAVPRRVHRGTRCEVTAPEGTRADLAEAARPADWALGELEAVFGTPLAKPLVIRLVEAGPRDPEAGSLMPGYLAHPLGEGVLLADIAAPAVPRGGEIIHELTHHYLGQVLGTSRPELANGANAFPRLVHEGLAEALRWRWVGEASGVSRDTLGHLRLVRAASASPNRRGLRELLDFAGYVNRLRAEDAPYFAHGWSLASFLLERPDGPACLRAVVENVRGGAGGAAAFETAVRAVFRETPEAFEAAWRRWIDDRWEGVLREARRAFEADLAKVESARRDVESLGDADFAKREAAGRRLAALGDAALPLVQPLLDHEDPEVRARARAIYDGILAPVRR